MKFKCYDCVNEGISDSPCILEIPDKRSNLSFMRPDWREALRRCPFENTQGNELTGESPVVKWERKK